MNTDMTQIKKKVRREEDRDRTLESNLFFMFYYIYKFTYQILVLFFS